MNHKLLSLLLCMLLVLAAVLGDNGAKDIESRVSKWAHEADYNLALNLFWSLLPNIVVSAVFVLANYVAALGDLLAIDSTMMVPVLLILLGYPMLLALADWALRLAAIYIPIPKFSNGAVLMDRLMGGWIDLVLAVAAEFWLNGDLHRYLEGRHYMGYLVYWIISDLAGLGTNRWIRAVLAGVWPLTLLVATIGSYFGQGDKIKAGLAWTGSQTWVDELVREDRVAKVSLNGNDREGLGIARVVLGLLVPLAAPIYYLFNYRGQRSLLLEPRDYYGESVLRALPSAEEIVQNIQDTRDDEGLKQAPRESPVSTSLARHEVRPHVAVGRREPVRESVKESVKESADRIGREIGVDSGSAVVSGVCALSISAVLLLVL